MPNRQKKPTLNVVLAALRLLLHSLPAAAFFYQRLTLGITLLLVAALPYIKTKKLSAEGQASGALWFWQSLTFKKILNLL